MRSRPDAAAERPPVLRILGRLVVPPRSAPRPAVLLSSCSILVALDGNAARQGVRSFLQAEAGLDVRTLPADGEAILAEVRVRSPSVLLLDAETRSPDAFEVLARVRAESPSVRVLLLVAGERPALVLRALAAGAAGHLNTGADAESYRAAVRQATRGERVLSAAVRDALVEQAVRGRAADTSARPPGLTRREFQVLRLVARGLDTTAIGADMGVSESTVRTHKAALRAKLGLDGDAALARYAFDQGLA